MCKYIIDQVQAYPWHNVYQIKVINLLTEVIEKTWNQNFRQNFLETSGLATSLAEMAKQATYSMESGSSTRNGYMGFVISVAN